MQNDPELNGKFLGTITEDFVKVADFIKESSYQIRKRGFSEYPIFTLSFDDFGVGLPLVRPNERDNKWSYNAALPEHMFQTEILIEDRFEEFKEIYKDPEEYCCLFVALPEFSNFVFLPYPEENDDTAFL
jgi:hypothetical protein